MNKTKKEELSKFTIVVVKKNDESPRWRYHWTIKRNGIYQKSGYCNRKWKAIIAAKLTLRDLLTPDEEIVYTKEYNVEVR